MRSISLLFLGLAPLAVFAVLLLMSGLPLMTAVAIFGGSCVIALISVAILVQIRALIVERMGLREPGSELWEELQRKAESTTQALGIQMHGIRDDELKATIRKLHALACEFLDHARQRPDMFVSEQRFTNFYLRNAFEMTRNHRILGLRAERNVDELATLKGAISELLPVFEHYAASAHKGLAPDVVLDARLLRRAIAEDLPKTA